jgi:hypothetical protein
MGAQVNLRREHEAQRLHARSLGLHQIKSVGGLP